MDISDVERWSRSSNIYDDLRGVDSLSRPKVASSYISPRQLDIPEVKRPTVSLIIPASAIEQMPTLDTVLPIEENKDFVINKDENLVCEANDYSCIWWTIRELIQLVCVALFASLIGMFVFTLLIYLFDIYWLEQPITNNSSSWWLYDNNTNLSETDHDMTTTIHTINYDDQY